MLSRARARERERESPLPQVIYFLVCGERHRGGVIFEDRRCHDQVTELNKGQNGAGFKSKTIDIKGLSRGENYITLPKQVDRSTHNPCNQNQHPH